MQRKKEKEAEKKAALQWEREREKKRERARSVKEAIQDYGPGVLENGKCPRCT